MQNCKADKANYIGVIAQIGESTKQDYMPDFRRDRRYDRTTGSELTFDYVVHKLGEVDFADAVSRLGFLPVIENGIPSNTQMELDFLGERYRLSKQIVNGTHNYSCAAVSGREVNLNFRSIVCYYALSKAQIEPCGDYCLVNAFSHGIFRSEARSWVSLKLAEIFEGLSPEEEAARFAQTALDFGMKSNESMKPPRTWMYQLLPKVPVRVVFYEKDDEFPPDLRIYYDKTAIMVFDFEPLAVLDGCFQRALVQALAA